MRLVQLLLLSSLFSTLLAGTTISTRVATIAATCPIGEYQAEYYANRAFDGKPSFTRCETGINYSWGQGGPGNGVGPDNFSVRWTGQHTFAAGSHTFTARTDAGIRVSLDGEQIINGRKGKRATTYTAARTLSAGTHEVKVEYYDRGGDAVAQVSWQAPATPPPPPQACQVLWSTDLETGDLSQWSHDALGGEFNSGNGDTAISSVIARSGQYSARQTIATGDGNAHGTRMFRWGEGRQHDALYYSVWYYFPQRYTPASWWNVFQFKSKTPTRNDAFWQLNIGNRPSGNMYLYAYNWVNTRRFEAQLTPLDLPVGRWVHIETYLRCAGDSSGQFTVWQDGNKIYDFPNVPTRYADGDCQWSVNNYSDGISPSPAVTYIDDAAISTTRVGPWLVILHPRQPHDASP